MLSLQDAVKALENVAIKHRRHVRRNFACAAAVGGVHDPRWVGALLQRTG
jgi:hypothetical protein